ncbi:MAG: DNA polymerase I [Candidatus Sumerlaeia bacterium]|nr:DNA polymerase I [Candidatus Sumerlaeia bacterium]
MAPTLYLVDGHSHLYKAFYAVRGLATSKGLPTNAVYGFVQTILRLMESRAPDHLAVVFDTPAPSFRNKLYPQYKANRDAQPEDLTVQIPWVKKVLAEMRLPVIEQPGFEADDVIATLATRARDAGFDVWIVTSDKDLYQLVEPNVRVLRVEPDREIELDADSVRQRMGVSPAQITDLLGLMGDSSDNIPGVPKVGEKTAVALLQEFPTIEALYDNLDRLSNPRFQRALEGHRELAMLCKQLATVRRDLPIEIPLDALRCQPPNVEGLRALYKQLEFQRLLDRLPRPQPAASTPSSPPDAPAAVSVPSTPPVLEVSPPPTSYLILDTEAKLRDFAIQIRPGRWLAVDTETSEVDPMRADLVGISLCTEPHVAAYIPVGHRLLAASQLPLEAVREILGPLLADPQIPKTGQNLKYDMKILERHGMMLEGAAFDTLLASYLLDPDRASHGLKSQARERLGIQMTAIEELIGSGRSQGSMADVEIERVAPYACADADVSLQLTQLLERDLREKGLYELFEQIELPLMAVLHRMEMTGVRIDREHFAELAQNFDSRLAALAREIYDLAGKTFNISSPKQVAKILFEEMGLQPARQLKTGPSTDMAVLEQLARQGHALPRKILDYRMLEKLKGTYVETLPQMVNPQTGRIHTSYNQAVAATGRLSSSDPNLQNIPVRTPEGRLIRRGFIPLEDGHLLLAADYSQIELRILAHFTGDPSLVEAFRRGRDIHRQTAARIFNVFPDDVTDSMRSQAKVVNFGIIYGMSAHGLAQQLEISRTQAARFIEDYFRAHPRVKEWTQEIVNTAREQGYVTTLSGRRRQIANITSRNQTLRLAAERAAINTPIQGTAADMIKLAMIAVDRRLADMKCRARMIMQVHDELIFDLPPGEVEVVRRAVVEEMENALPLSVPLRVDVNVGKNWEEI